DPGQRREVAAHFATSLVPLGFGMWLMHYLFHFLTSAGTVVPVVHRALADIGVFATSSPDWNGSLGMAPAGLIRLQIVFLDLGLLISLFTAYRIACERRQHIGLALRAFAPWALLLLALFAVGIWVVFQPMQMRGTLLPG